MKKMRGSTKEKEIILKNQNSKEKYSNEIEKFIRGIYQQTQNTPENSSFELLSLRSKKKIVRKLKGLTEHPQRSIYALQKPRRKGAEK